MKKMLSVLLSLFFLFSLSISVAAIETKKITVTIQNASVYEKASTASKVLTTTKKGYGFMPIGQTKSFWILKFKLKSNGNVYTGYILKADTDTSVAATSTRNNALSKSGSSSKNTLEDKINAMDLEPLVTDIRWDEEDIKNVYGVSDFYKHLDKVIKNDMTNYQKLCAVYNDVLKNSKANVCAGSALLLADAFEYAGFRTYQIRGETKAAGGGWAAHSWVGINVEGESVYFDVNLPGFYGISTDKCFAVSAKDATIYRNAVIEEWYLDPEVRERVYHKP